MFHSLEIQQSFEALDKKSKSFVLRLDQISQDIKSLEQALTEKNIPLEVCIGVTRKLFPTPQEKELFSNAQYQPLNIVAQEWLSWCRDDKSARMRLVHMRVLTTNGSPLSAKQSPLPVIIRKPLIESTTEERLRCFAKLPRLLSAIGSVMMGEHVSLFE